MKNEIFYAIISSNAIGVFSSEMKANKECLYAKNPKVKSFDNLLDAQMLCINHYKKIKKANSYIDVQPHQLAINFLYQLYYFDMYNLRYNPGYLTSGK